jgi:hypothetical protein
MNNGVALLTRAKTVDGGFAGDGALRTPEA